MKTHTIKGEVAATEFAAVFTAKGMRVFANRDGDNFYLKLAEKPRKGKPWKTFLP